MEMNDLLGYNLICRMSSLDKNELYYDGREFEVIVEKNEGSESGYVTLVSAYDEEDQYVTYERDTEEVCNKFLHGNWDIVRRERI